MLFFGQFLRVLTVGFTEISYGEETGGLYAERLIQDGLYAFLRNPLYLGNFLIGVGLLWLSHRPMFLVCGALGLWAWTLLLAFPGLSIPLMLLAAFLASRAAYDVYEHNVAAWQKESVASFCQAFHNDEKEAEHAAAFLLERFLEESKAQTDFEGLGQRLKDQEKGFMASLRPLRDKEGTLRAALFVGLRQKANIPYGIAPRHVFPAFS